MPHRPTVLFATLLGLLACEDDPDPLRLATPVPDPLPALWLGVDFELRIEVEHDAGATPRFRAEGLPPGLDLRPYGRVATIAGAPTELGRFPVSLRVEAEDQRLERRFVLRVVEPLRVTTTGLDPARRGVAYAAELSASGGDGETTWSVTGLPAGLTAAGRRIAGTPEVAGDFALRVEVLEVASSRSVTAELTLEVLDDDQLALAPGQVDPETGILTLPVGVVGEAYEARVEVEGGKAPFAWTTVGLPQGLRLGGSGREAVIAGTPEAPGSFELTLGVEAAGGASIEVPSELLVVEPLRLSADPLGAVPSCTAVDHLIEATGGIGGELDWSVTQGQLPSGLSLRAEGSRARIVGVTTAVAEAAAVVVEARDRLGLTASLELSVEVSGESPPDRFLAYAGTLETAEPGVFVLDRCSSTGAGVRVSTGDTHLLNGTPDVRGYANGMEIDAAGEKLVFLQQGPGFGTEVRLADLRSGPMPGSGRVVLPEQPTSDVRVGFSPDGRWLAITAEQEATYDASLWLVDVSDPGAPGSPVLVSDTLPQGSNTVQTTARHRFSPDGRRFAYLQGDVFATELHVRSLAGGDVGPSTLAYGRQDTGAVRDFLWTADGRGLVYIGRFDNQLSDEPFFSDLSGSGPYSRQRILTQIPQRAAGFRSDSMIMRRFGRSPRGDAFHFVGARELGGTEELLVVPYAAGRFESPTVVSPANTTASVAPITVSWDPSGDRIAFAFGGFGGDSGLHVAERTASGWTAPVRLSETLLGPSQFGGEGTDHGWMCGGEVVVFLSVDENGSKQLYTADLRRPTLEARPVTAAPSAAPGIASFTISPDRTKLAYARPTQPNRIEGFVIEDLCEVDPAATPVPLHPSFTDEPTEVWLGPGLGTGPSVFWSADSQSLFSLGLHRQGRFGSAYELYQTAVGTTAPYVPTRLVAYDEDLFGSTLTGLTVQGFNPRSGR